MSPTLHRRVHFVAVAWALWALAPGCDGMLESPARRRADWLRATHYVDRRQLLPREPTLVADKLARLSESPFDDLRGTPPQWVRDTSEPGALGTNEAP